MNQKRNTTILVLALILAGIVVVVLNGKSNAKTKKGTTTTTAVGDKGVTMSGDRTVPCIGGDCFYLTAGDKIENL
jgi:sarcosine oxidase gamma subunit